jgi:hypothetical protein
MTCAASILVVTPRGNFVIPLISVHTEHDIECGDWRPWGPWSGWGDWPACTFGTRARTRVHTRTRPCNDERHEVCTYFGGSGSAIARATRKHLIGVFDLPDEVEDDYEYDFGFCFFSGRVAALLDTAGDHAVGAEEASLGTFVLGHSMLAEVPEDMLPKIKSQAYRLDGEPIKLPFKLTELKPGPHVISGSLKSTAGARIAIDYPFEVAPQFTVTVPDAALRALGPGRVSQCVTVRNNEPAPRLLQLTLDAPDDLPARLSQPHVTINGGSTAVIGIDYSLCEGVYERTRRVTSAGHATLTVTGNHSEVIALPSPAAALLESLDTPLPASIGAAALDQQMAAVMRGLLAQGLEAAEAQAIETVPLEDKSGPQMKEGKADSNDFEDIQSEVFSCSDDGHGVSFLVCDVPGRTLDESINREVSSRFSCEKEECSSGFKEDRREHVVGSVCVDENGMPTGTSYKVWGKYFCRCF